MTDLISKSAALDNAWQVMYKDEWHMTQTEQVVSVNDIEALPTIDAVPVVRCRDCKHHDGIRCFRWNSVIVTGFDDFCSEGERSEE